MNETKQMEMIFLNVVKPKLEKDLEDLGNIFKKVVMDYAWLFDHDLNKSKDMFLQFYLDQLDITTNQIKLDYANFYQNVSEKIKKEMYEKAMEKFISSLSVNELQGRSVSDSSNIQESSKEEDLTDKSISENKDEEFPM